MHKKHKRVKGNESLHLYINSLLGFSPVNRVHFVAMTPL